MSAVHPERRLMPLIAPTIDFPAVGGNLYALPLKMRIWAYKQACYKPVNKLAYITQCQ